MHRSTYTRAHAHVHMLHMRMCALHVYHATFPFYRYFNVPVETAQDAKANPLRALKSLGSVDDFIVVKVDIDTPSIEEPLIAQILDDEGLSELIDELYFEHHVLLSPMRKWWATGLNDTGCAVQDSYALFHALRQRGIRAHSWV